ncbi:MAG: hypothetical protein WDM88_12220 [Galbitalea sp.]
MSTFSFEMYPPRSPAAELALYGTIDHLVARRSRVHRGDLRRERIDA